MFPDLEKGNIAGGAVGLLIPESVTEVDRWGDSQLASLYMTKHSNSREIFESLLAELTTSFKTQEDVSGVRGVQRVLLQSRQRPRLGGRGCR